VLLLVVLGQPDDHTAVGRVELDAVGPTTSVGAAVGAAVGASDGDGGGTSPLAPVVAPEQPRTSSGTSIPQSAEDRLDSMAGLVPEAEPWAAREIDANSTAASLTVDSCSTGQDARAGFRGSGAGWRRTLP
jgi:hypothetical protein